MSDSVVLQVGVKVALINSEGKYLLLHRSEEKYPDVDGRWDIVGGRIDPGTGLFANLQREVREETELELVKEPRLIAAQDILRIKGRHIVRLSYKGEIEGVPVLDEENDKYGWFTCDDLLGMKDGELDIYVKDLLERGLLK